MKLEVSIRKNLRDFVLAVEFTACEEVFALLGASGSGKSITLKCIAGIETPDEGRIVLNGRTLFDAAKKINLPPQARRAGYLFQNYALFPNMTVAENILFAAIGSREEKILKLKKNITRFKLNGLEDVYPQKLSGGQRQRVALARILASPAEFLLFDEPFSALDSFLKWQLEPELADILKSYGKAAILVSHDRNEVFRLADRVAVLNSGKVEALGSKHEVFASPPTVAVAQLTGVKNISRAKKISDDKIFAEDWQLLLTGKEIPEGLKAIGIRARDFEHSSEVNADDNIFAFQILQVTENELTFTLTIRAKATSNDARPLQWEVDKNFILGTSDEIFLHLPADKIIFFLRVMIWILRRLSLR